MSTTARIPGGDQGPPYEQDAYILGSRTLVAKSFKFVHTADMTSTTTELLENVLSLPDVDRSYLVSKLLESLDEGGVPPEWDEEVERRVKSIHDGSARLVSHDKVMADARRAIQG